MTTNNNHVHELANQANELTEDELNHVSGGSFTYTKQKADGTSAGNVTGGWDLVNNKVHA
jgi:bacteriocin-like protein